MHYSRLFDSTIDFDLLTGELPAELRPYFGDQVRRARKILKDRTEEEVEYALDSLEWMLKSGMQTLFANAIIEEEEFPEGRFINNAKALKYLDQEYDISDQADFPDATWAEYFAILTLSYIPELMILEKYSPPIKPESPIGRAVFEYIQRHGGDMRTQWALETMEAICYAEQLQHITGSASNYGSIGGNKRAAKYNDIKQKVIDLYLAKYTARSNRDAARIIYKIMKEEIDAVLNNDDPVKRIEIWIGKHVRNKKKQAR